MNIKALEAEYQRLVKIAQDSNYDLTPAFEMELFRLTRLLKTLGSKVVG